MKTVVIQYFDGCPHAAAMIDNVKLAIAGLNSQVTYSEIKVEDRFTARKENFRGSPTLLIDGEDYENLPPPLEPALSCRVYKNGVPKPEEIRAKLLL